MSNWIIVHIDQDKLDKLKADSQELNELKDNLKWWQSSIVYLNTNNKIIYEWAY